MITVLLILGILIAILLIGVVLIQNPKGGGLDSSFGAVNQLGSVRKTTDVVEKATWTLAVAIAVVSLISATFIPRGNVQQTGGKEGRTEAPIELNQPGTALPGAPGGNIINPNGGGQ